MHWKLTGEWRGMWLPQTPGRDGAAQFTPLWVKPPAWGALSGGAATFLLTHMLSPHSPGEFLQPIKQGRQASQRPH